MKTSWKWIRDLVPGLANVTPKEYADRMILSGSKVEFYTAMDADLEKIVIGQIQRIEPHPDADKLIVCQVDIGRETVQIVTGAKNVREGDKVPVVLDGGRVAGGHDGSLTPGGVKIKKGKLRGIESCGMMCAIEELGSNRDMFPEAPEDGIYIFPADAVVGENAVSALGLDDVVFEYEITSNRVDCFSVLGIAREAAATFETDFCPLVVKETGDDDDVNRYIKVRIEDEDLCARYTARVVKDIKIAPSPKWMQQRLMAQGIRPINNIVDITNYVMEEYGQPMHAYDLDTIAGHEIIVKRAKKGDTFVTLDGQTRQLDDSILMICDGEKAVGIGGIMGGENSMITDDVHTMLFEAACFDGTNIRLSSKKLGHRTDASAIFEKGLDPNTAEEAMNRACELIEELGAGTVCGGMVDVYPKKRALIRLPFEPERYNALLGTEIPAETMLSYFKRLSLGFDESTKEVLIPSWRQDLLSYADLAEEVARFFGYDKIPTTLPKGEATAGKLSHKLFVEQITKNVAKFCGFSQGMCYSFESPKVFDKLLLPKEDPARQAIVIANPLGEDYSIMRTLPLNGMLTSLATNFNRRNKDVRLFELGNVYLPEALPLTELPDERMMLTLGMYGAGDFYELKGVFEELFSALGLKEKAVYDPAEKKPFLHPGRQARVMYGGKEIGYLGEVHPLVVQNYDMKGRVYIGVLDMGKVTALSDFTKKYEGITNFPASTRDFSLVVPKDVPVGAIEDVFDRKGGAYLEGYTLFDLYEGDQIGEGFKSVAYSLVFRAKDKSLSDEDVTGATERILKALGELKVTLRS